MSRWLVRICVFLILGAIVNVGAAWGCAWFSDHRRGIDVDAGRAAATWSRYLPLPHDASVRAWGLRSAGMTRHLVYATRQPSSGDASRATERWAARVPDWAYPRLQEITCGWPAPALRGAVDYSERRTFDVWPAEIGTDMYGPPGLPYHLIAPGFAINTVFYAGVLWTLFAMPAALRRKRRIRRGLCPKCAYDLRGSDSVLCPECGRVK